MISTIEGYSEVDDDIADAYRRQARECRAAMHAVLAGGWSQAAALLAVQAVRAGANALLATCVGIAATGQGADPLDLLYRHVPVIRGEEHLTIGAEVLAYDEDLRTYGFELQPEEADQLLMLADRFCAWADR